MLSKTVCQKCDYYRELLLTAWEKKIWPSSRIWKCYNTGVARRFIGGYFVVAEFFEVSDQCPYSLEHLMQNDKNRAKQKCSVEKSVKSASITE